MNTIKFLLRQELIGTDLPLPVPTKTVLPEWFKELKYTDKNRNIKGCVPFLEAVTTGYVLKVPQDFEIKWNVTTKKDNQLLKDAFINYAGDYHIIDPTLNFNQGRQQEAHPLNQVGEKCPFLKKHGNYKIPKLLNPFIIQTPPGYSCMFIPLLNNTDERFTPLAGIVHTDKFYAPVNFPYIINAPLEKTVDSVVKKGTPFIQIIPFKRESWKMKVEPVNTKKHWYSYFSLSTTIIHAYKNLFWNKTK